MCFHRLLRSVSPFVRTWLRDFVKMGYFGQIFFDWLLQMTAAYHRYRMYSKWYEFVEPKGLE
jgi:hypothetical protein